MAIQILRTFSTCLREEAGKDYESEENSLFNNIGFEYTYSMDRRKFSQIQQCFFVDKNGLYLADK